MNWERALERVREVAAFCRDAGLESFRIEDDDLSIEVRRSGVVAAPSIALESAEVRVHEAPVPNGAVGPADLSATTVLKAEFVGIVRFSRPPVSEGTTLTEERELAYVESLGIRNPINSKPGRVSAVYVSDGQPVEYGQPLFAVESG